MLGPLGMNDTTFHVEGDGLEKLAVLYMPDLFTRSCDACHRIGEAAFRRPRAPLGGSGLVSTAGDYHRFTQMLWRHGELDGVRILGGALSPTWSATICLAGRT